MGLEWNEARWQLWEGEHKEGGAGGGAGRVGRGKTLMLTVTLKEPAWETLKVRPAALVQAGGISFQSASSPAFLS